MPDQTPLTEAELEAIRALWVDIRDEHTDSDGYRDVSIDLMGRKLQKVLAEVDRLRAENAELQHSNEHHKRYRYTAEQNAHDAALEARNLRAELAKAPSHRDVLVAEEVMRAAQLGQHKAEVDRDALAAKLDAMPEPHEEWAIRVVKTLGGSSWYHHESSAETAEDDRAQVLEILADSRDMTGQPVEHGPVSIVRRTVWASDWETAPDSPRPPAEAADSTADDFDDWLLAPHHDTGGEYGLYHDCNPHEAVIGISEQSLSSVLEDVREHECEESDRGH